VEIGEKDAAQTGLALLQGERLQSRPEAQQLFELDQTRRK
jgi:hypothetical protein